MGSSSKATDFKTHPGGKVGAPEMTLVPWGGVLNGAWEFMHSPLYADHSHGLAHIIYTRLHCTLGDVFILLGAYWSTSLLFQTRYWPFRPNVMMPTLCFIMLGLTYTIFSEWRNAVVTKTWEYATQMPLIYGIGLTPILQWIVVPPILIWIIHRKRIRWSSAAKTMDGNDA